MKSTAKHSLFVLLFFAIFLLPGAGLCGEPVDLFPVPVSDDTTLFPSVDDDFLEVSFTEGFTFPFYDTTYDSIFLNTNGGFTFGSGDKRFDVAATEVTQPGVAIFWGDMCASCFEAYLRPHQMVYQQFADRFVIAYSQFQDYDVEAWHNTATVTLYSTGTIVIEYGEVLSEDILVAVFDGTHTDDKYLPLQTIYEDYQSTGTGIILFDYWGEGPGHEGELSGRTITFKTETVCEEDDSGALDIPGTRGAPGGTVTIPVRIQSAPNDVSSLGFEVFPPSVLAFTGYTTGPLVEDFDFFDCNVPADKPNVVRCGGFKAEGGIAAGASGDVVSLTFDVSPDCEGIWTVGLQELKDDIASWSATHGCFDCSFTCDVNGDGEVTPQDALCAFQKYLGICPTACGPCQDIFCDVTGDNDCTPGDALEIFREYLGLPSVCSQ